MADVSDAPEKTKSPPKKTISMQQLVQQLSVRFEKEMQKQLTAFVEKIGKETEQKIESAVKRLEGQIGSGSEIRTRPIPQQDHLEESTALNDQGVQLYYQGELAQAAQFLENALKFHPESVEALNNLAVVYTGLNETEKAVSAFQKAVELDPNRAEVLNNKGVLALLDAQPEEALSYLEEADQTESLQIPVLLNLAQAHHALGDYKRAIQAWKLVIAVDPDQEEAARNLKQYYQ